MNRLKNVPVIPQMEEVEGGAACLAMVLGHYGKWVPLDQVRSACGVSRDGTKTEDIIRAAESYSLSCISRIVRICSDLEGACFICPLHDLSEITGKLRCKSFDCLGIDASVRSVKRDAVSLMINSTTH